MNLWTARNEALAALDGDMKIEGSLISEVIDRIDDCVRLIEMIDTKFSRVCGLTLIKARNLGQGCFSLCLDGLGQEAGALFRPLIEALELMTYFRSDPSRVDQALDGRLPTAGKRAKIISGSFKDLRKNLNETAAHVGWAEDSMRHLFDTLKPGFRIQQQFHPHVLRPNLGVLFAILVWVAIEGVNCAGVAGELLQHELADSVEELKTRGLTVFQSETSTGTG